MHILLQLGLILIGSTTIINPTDTTGHIMEVGVTTHGALDQVITVGIIILTDITILITVCMAMATAIIMVTTMVTTMDFTTDTITETIMAMQV